VTIQQVLQRRAHLGDRATLDREDQATAHAAFAVGPPARQDRQVTLSPSFSLG
jgi:hypothetical protein